MNNPNQDETMTTAVAGDVQTGDVNTDAKTLQVIEDGRAIQVGGGAKGEVIAMGALLTLAIERGVSPEALEKLVMLNERIEDRAAAKEFADKLAEFQRECPVLRKNAKANITTKAGGSYGYTYASLDHIADRIRELLTRCGFSYSWDTTIEANKMVVTCTLRHVNGHSASSSFTCPTESNSAMSEQQKYASARTFGERMSLTQVLGITTADRDTDGANPETITEDEARTLIDLANAAGADKARFLKLMGVEAFDQILRANLRVATNTLEAKKRERDAKKAQVAP